MSLVILEKALSLIEHKIGCKFPIVQKLTGFTIANRFVIGKAKAKGAFGWIYSGYDL